MSFLAAAAAVVTGCSVGLGYVIWREEVLITQLIAVNLRSSQPPRGLIQPPASARTDSLDPRFDECMQKAAIFVSDFLFVG